mmetsp:Transcript_60995/g.132138  ORF Transcript_60995/g.132138 Transcript_60995/m.132138 type:complete len:94 (+) Transcript_60995:2417-2698(+)
MQVDYKVKVNKLLKDWQAAPTSSTLADELDSRINEIKRMRDGAEMDLDLDITQRMLENDHKDVNNMADVISAVSTGCTLLSNENSMLEEEVQY